MLVGPTWVCLFFFFYLFDYFLARNLEVRFLLIPSVIRLYLPVAVRAARRLSSCAALFSQVVFPVPLRRVTAADNGAGVGAAASVGRPRLFALPRLMVGLGAARCGAAAAAPDCNSSMAAHSLKLPLDLKPFAALGGSLLEGEGRRRPPRRGRTWDGEDGWWGLQEAWWARPDRGGPAIPASGVGRRGIERRWIR
jgi:hypothetical protein